MKNTKKKQPLEWLENYSQSEIKNIITYYPVIYQEHQQDFDSGRLKLIFVYNSEGAQIRLILDTNRSTAYEIDTLY